MRGPDTACRHSRSPRTRSTGGRDTPGHKPNDLPPAPFRKELRRLRRSCPRWMEQSCQPQSRQPRKSHRHPPWSHPPWSRPSTSCPTRSLSAPIPQSPLYQRRRKSLRSTLRKPHHCHNPTPPSRRQERRRPWPHVREPWICRSTERGHRSMGPGSGTSLGSDSSMTTGSGQACGTGSGASGLKRGCMGSGL